MNRVRYIDTYGYKNGHEIFNASLLMMCSMIFDQIECRASKSNYECINAVLGDKMPRHIKYKKCFVIGGDGRLALMLRYIVSAFSNVRQLIVAPKNRILIYSFNNPFGIRILNFTNKVCRKNVIIFCHGEMESVVSTVNVKGLLSRILMWLGRDFFLNHNIKICDSLYFSVMGDRIKENLSKSLSEDKISKFICVDHPYIFTSKPDINSVSTETVNIGMAGTVNSSKGLDKMIEFIESIPDKIRDHVNISITGRLFGDREKLKMLGVDISPAKDQKSLPRVEFDRRLAKLDYLLFFYPNDSYKVTASGAIMDAICQRKPILSLNNDYFQYIFKKFGSFGYLFDNIAQLEAKLEDMIESREKPEIDFDMIQSKFMPEVISSQLRRQLSNIGFIE